MQQKPAEVTLSIHGKEVTLYTKQAISAYERALCQLTVCLEFQSRIDRRKGHKSRLITYLSKIL